MAEKKFADFATQNKNTGTLIFKACKYAPQDTENTRKNLIIHW